METETNIHCLNAYAVDGDLRLVLTRQVNGYTIGSLQMFVDGTFGTVCATGLDRTDADVACRQLGFVGGGIAPLAPLAFTRAELEVHMVTS